MRRKHFTVGIDVYPCSLGLFQQFFKILQVMAADKDTRIVAHTEINFWYFRISVAACVGCIQQSHCGNSVFTCGQCKLNQFFHRNIIAGEFG